MPAGHISAAQTKHGSNGSSRKRAARTSSKEAAEEERRVKRKVNRGLTCANCRTRKTRCDGGQPGCKTCEVYETECRYDQLPPLSQVRELTRRLQEAEDMIKDLQNRPSSSAQSSTSSPPAFPPLSNADEWAAPSNNNGEAIDFGLPDSHSPLLALSQLKNGQSHSSSGGVQTNWNPLPINGGLSGLQQTLPTSFSSFGSGIRACPTDIPNKLGVPSDLSIDAQGQLCYYGPTSNVHEPPGDTANQDMMAASPSRTDVRTMLTKNAMEMRAWEEMAMGNAALQTDIPRETMKQLLSIHWTWIAPTFMWVYRPAFMRDMTTGGQYCSPFLVNILCAHSARFSENPVVGEMLISRARLMLGTEIDKAVSIPTVQGLLQLSARDLAYGRISQAWLYSGMAFRMVSDLGLHHSAGKISGLGKLNAEDLEIRRRLFWSCYFWDKAISLYLGRMPVLLELPMDAAPELLDDTVEHELWSPHSGGSVNLSNCAVGDYPSYKSHAISCFINSCKLSVIISSIIQHLYSRRSNTDLESAVPAIPARLEEWRRNTPQHLIMDPDNLPRYCPPPNILAQNLLYYTTVILLHRPFLSSTSHRAKCRAAAIQTEKLLLLLESTFSFTRITYIMAYCIYTAATVLLLDVKAGDQEASRRMETLLRALKQGISTCPILQRSLDIILNSLREDVTVNNGPSTNAMPTIQQPQPNTDVFLPVPNNSSTFDPTLFPSNDTQSTVDPNSLINSLLPAFLFAENNPDPAQDINTNHDPFNLLDCFPENRLDGFPGDWFLS